MVTTENINNIMRKENIILLFVSLSIEIWSGDLSIGISW